MNPLRLLGRVMAPSSPAQQAPQARAATPAERGPVASPSDPDSGVATRAARPAGPRSPTDDPSTDPHGWPPIPVPPMPGLPISGLPVGGLGLAPSVNTRPMPHRDEAAGLAVAFAVDYLSWDEDDAARRGRVLAGYLRDPGDDPTRLGWSGHGRQRAELAAPGRVSAAGAGRVVVDVRVRVTPYRSVGAPGLPPDPVLEPEPAPESEQAVAPAPTGRGWRALASEWIRLSIPVVLDEGRLMIDSWSAAPAPAAEEAP